MADSTGSPWALPSPELTEAPNGPTQVSALADAVHSALGRAYPCTSTTRPSHEAGLYIYETDTDLLYVSDGSAWLPMDVPNGIIPVCRMEAASAQSIADDSAFHTVTWTSATVTETIAGIGVPADDMMVIPADGWYRLTWRLTWNTNSYTGYRLGIFYDGLQAVWEDYKTAVSGTYSIHTSTSIPLLCSQDDEITLNVKQTGGTSVDLAYANGRYHMIGLDWVCDPDGRAYPS